MTNVLLVSEQYLRDNLPISRNLDTKDIKPNIQSAQELYLQEILGNNFYDYILTTFSAQTLNADEITLVQDYIKPAVAYRTLAMALPFLSLQIKNKGPQTQSDDFSQPSDFRGLTFLISNAENRAEFYEERLKKYLCKYSSLYPQYTSNNNDIIPPIPGNRFDSGLLFY
jgi:hypothetical protein